MKPIEILLVEDNLGDVLLMQETLHDSKILNNLHVVSDGVDAWHFLTKTEAHTAAITPDLILLDLNLPRMNGRELLAKIKLSDHLKRIPVIIMTTSEAEEDILQTYNLHANAYVTKPVDLEKFSDIVKAIDAFWLTIVRLPPHDA